MQNQKSKNNILIFIAVLILFLGFLIYLITPLETEVIPTSFFLSENPGFDIRPDALSFGGIIANQTGARFIIIKNNFNKDIFVEIKSSGEAVGNVIVSENNFYLSPGEEKKLTFTADTIGLSEYREYKGEIEIISKRTFLKK